VTVVDDRPELFRRLPANSVRTATIPADQFIAGREWKPDEALIIVSRNYQVDREALHAALQHRGAGYLGMIGSARKVRRVFDELKERGVDDGALSEIYAPLGLDVGADSPAEIAISVMAEVLQVLRGRPGGHLRGMAKLP
jgi:xanthine dehydrogenase accessory factor